MVASPAERKNFCLARAEGKGSLREVWWIHEPRGCLAAARNTVYTYRIPSPRLDLLTRLCLEIWLPHQTAEWLFAGTSGVGPCREVWPDGTEDWTSIFEKWMRVELLDTERKKANTNRALGDMEGGRGVTRRMHPVFRSHLAQELTTVEPRNPHIFRNSTVPGMLVGWRRERKEERGKVAGRQIGTISYSADGIDPQPPPA